MPGVLWANAPRRRILRDSVVISLKACWKKSLKKRDQPKERLATGGIATTFRSMGSEECSILPPQMIGWCSPRWETIRVWKLKGSKTTRPRTRSSHNLWDEASSRDSKVYRWWTREEENHRKVSLTARALYKSYADRSLKRRRTRVVTVRNQSVWSYTANASTPKSSVDNLVGATIAATR